MSADGSLSVTNLSAGYGRVPVVFDVSFTLRAGEMVALVGRNGAGKSTSLAAVAGLRFGPCGGTVMLNDRDLTGANSDEIVRAGLKLVPEGRRLFREMTVYQNLRLGAFLRRREGRREVDAAVGRVYDLFPALAVARDRTVLSLSGGQQQMVAVGQALMTTPKYLALDEPTAGLAPALIDTLYEAFTALAAQGIGLLIVDQNIERVLESTSRYYVVDNGRVVLDGDCEIGAIDQVVKIVLGSERQREETLDRL
jgi:branched-chain amino acid transport system ATP-binding protein